MRANKIVDEVFIWLNLNEQDPDILLLNSWLFSRQTRLIMNVILKQDPTYHKAKHSHTRSKVDVSAVGIIS